jgi:hypothetical protein
MLVGSVGKVEEPGRGLGAGGASRELAEDLLDVLLTTYNSASIHPEIGVEVARIYMSGSIASPESIELLLKLCAKVEPEKTSAILRKHGIDV